MVGAGTLALTVRGLNWWQRCNRLYNVHGVGTWYMGPCWYMVVYIVVWSWVHICRVRVGECWNATCAKQGPAGGQV